MEEGYLKIPRRLFERASWLSPRAFGECEAWLDLLQSARSASSPATALIGGRSVTWGRGQVPVSLRFLAARWGRSVRWVTAFLRKAEAAGLATADGSQGTTVVTVPGFDSYAGKRCGTGNGTAGALCHNVSRADAGRLSAERRGGTGRGTGSGTGSGTADELETMWLQAEAERVAERDAEQEAGKAAERHGGTGRGTGSGTGRGTADELETMWLQAEAERVAERDAEQAAEREARREEKETERKETPPPAPPSKESKGKEKEEYAPTEKETYVLRTYAKKKAYPAVNEGTDSACTVPESGTPPSCGSPPAASRFACFTEWLSANAPSVLRMRRPFTEAEFGRLRSLYGFDEMESVLTDMENKTELCRKYKSAYLTCRKWLERDFGRRCGS